MFGFFALLRVAIRDELPDIPEVVVVFDGEFGGAERRKLDPAYKAHRPTDEAALAPIKALPEAKRGLDDVGIDWIEVADAEADDVIATLVHHAPDRDIVIMSADRDFYQLLTDRVVVLNTARRPGERLIGPKHVEAQYGVPPAFWCDRTALVGDTSDGIKGIRGIGKRTAARLLAGGLSLEDLPVSGRLINRTGQLVRDGFQTALACRDLARMRTDILVPLLPRDRPSPLLPAPAAMLDRLQLW